MSGEAGERRDEDQEEKAGKTTHRFPIAASPGGKVKPAAPAVRSLPPSGLPAYSLRVAGKPATQAERPAR